MVTLQGKSVNEANYTDKIVFYTSPQGEVIESETYIYDFYNLIGEMRCIGNTFK